MRKNSVAVLIIAILSLSLVTVLPISSAAVPADRTIAVSADTYVDSSVNTTNYGSLNKFYVKDYAGTYRLPYLKFDLTNIRPDITNADIRSATLKLWVIGSTSSGSPIPMDINIAAFHVTDDSWTESGLTYKNCTAHDNAPAGQTTTITANTIGGTEVDIDITNGIINELANPSDNTFSCAIDTVGNPVNEAVWFYSRENTYKPVLVVSYKQKVYPEPITSVSLTENGQPAASLTGGDTKVDVGLKNWLGTPNTPAVMFAVYKSNPQKNASSLYNISMVNNCPLDANGTGSVSAEFNLPDNSDGLYSMKIFVLDSITGLGLFSKQIYIDSSDISYINQTDFQTGSSNTPVFGSDLKAEVDRDTGIVTVSGSVIDGTEMPVTVMVTDANVALSDINSDNVSQEVFYSDIVIPQNNSFSCKFVFDDRVLAQNYNVFVKTRDVDTIAQLPVNYYLNASQQLALDKVNKADSVDAFASDINNYATLLSLNISLLNRPYINRDDIINSLYALKPFSDAASLTKAYNVAIALNTMQYAASQNDSAAFRQALENNMDSLGISAEWAAIYQGDSLSSAVKDEFISRMMKSAFTADNLPDLFMDTLVLSAFVKAEKYNDLQNCTEVVFKDYFAQMIESNKYYAKIKSKTNLYKKMSDYQFASITDIQTAFNTSCQAEYNEENKPKASGGGGGSPAASYHVQPTPAPAIAPAPTAAPQSPESYQDIDQAAWAAESIKALTEKGVVSGDGNGHFYPTELVKREEFTKMLVIVFGFTDNSAASSFSDIDKSAWYYPYVSAAAKLGIVDGQSDGSFGAGKTITRQDMAVLVYRALKLKGGSLSQATASFTDSGEIDGYAKEAVSALTGGGILNGMGDGTFSPKSALTRAEAAKVLYAISNKI